MGAISVAITFDDNTIAVKSALESAVGAFLEEACGEWEAMTAQNTRVDTGQLKSSWNHQVNFAKHEGVVGSPLENAIWEEMGTGEYALGGNGRKTPWRYKDRQGGWHTTRGKRPSRAFYRAYLGVKTGIREQAVRVFGEKMGK
jgi:hypothetical protein